MSNVKPLTRREFLKLSAMQLGSLLIHPDWAFARSDPDQTWPELVREDLPETPRKIISLQPSLYIDPAGYLKFMSHDARTVYPAALYPTDWNLSNSDPHDRLLNNKPWGLVLHWFGDPPGFSQDPQAYLRGFNQVREMEGYYTNTSAHFLVGDGAVNNTWSKNSSLSIIQTQYADQDGTPFVASHLKLLDYLGHQDRNQYFVRAYYELQKTIPGVHALLQDLYDGPVSDPNQRTLAIEITGQYFDSPGGRPSPQKIANVLALVWAIMLRYQIPASHILGHHEIQLGKSDPGKAFMTLIRYLLGTTALLSNSNKMKQLVFGSFLQPGMQPQKAVENYFDSVHTYFILTATPLEVHLWEEWSKYWLVMQTLKNPSAALPQAQQLENPFNWLADTNGQTFLLPIHHTGVDFHTAVAANYEYKAVPRYARLAAPGKCVFLGQSTGCCPGKMAIFRHQLSNGTRIDTIYGHLTEINSLALGQIYPAGTQIGSLFNHANCYLHFSVAYAATHYHLPTDLIVMPHNIGQTWITNRFADPVSYLTREQTPPQKRNGLTFTN